MKATRKVSGWWREIDTKILLLVFVSSVAYALYTLNDTNVMRNYINTGSFFVQVSTYLLLGGWFGIPVNWLIGILISRVTGKNVDKNYEGIKFSQIVSSPSAIRSGIFGALATALTLYGFNEGKTILVVLFTSLLSIAVVIVDRDASKRKTLIVPSMVAATGALMLSIKDSSDALGKLSLDGMALLMVVMLIFMVVDVKNRENNDAKKLGSTAFSFWRFVWLAISATVVVLIASVVFGYTSELVSSVKSMLGLEGILVVCLTFVFVTISAVTQNEAIHRKGASPVVLLDTSKGVFAFLLTILAHYMWNTQAYVVPSTVQAWVLSFLGVLLITVGVGIAIYKTCIKEK